MKKLGILGVCFVLILAVFAYSASAAITVTNTYNSGNPTFGGDSQTASNDELDEDDSDYDVYTTGNVQIFNNGATNVTIDGLSFSPQMGYTNADLNITLKSSVIVPANGSATVLIDARVPDNLDAVDNNQEPVAWNVANIILKSGSTDVVSFSSYMQRKNYLVIDSVKFEIGDDSQSVNENGDNVKDVKPGDVITLTIKVESKFRDSDELDIDVDGQWEILDDIDEEDDLDDIGTLGPKEDEEQVYTFKIEEDVDDGNYEFIVWVFGEDDNGAEHGQRITAEIQVEKKSHEIAITNIVVVPAEGSCGDSFSVKVEVANIGKKNEDEVTIRVANDNLEIDAMKTNIELDEGDTTSRTFDLVVPSDAETGSKAFTVTSFYNFNEESNRKTFAFDVTDCEANVVVDTSSDDDADDTTADVTPPAATSGGTVEAQPTAGSTTTPAAPSPVTTVSSSKSGEFKSSTFYIILLILAIVIVVMAGAMMIAKMLIVR